jgi:hypothetical protein
MLFHKDKSSIKKKGEEVRDTQMPFQFKIAVLKKSRNKHPNEIKPYDTNASISDSSTVNFST